MKVLSDLMLKEEYQKALKEAIIIDIREADEYAREHIANSENIPASTLKEEDIVKFKDKVVLFHCKAGVRTRNISELLSRVCKDAFCLEGGLDQWKRCGLPTIINKKAPMDIMRQVQIMTGSLIILGVILALTFNHYFLIITSFVGLGLIFSGVTGSCGMANLLRLMPWNR